jgi:MFS family permease
MPPGVKPIYPLVSYLFLNQCALTAARFIVVLYAIQLQASTAVIGLLISMFALAPLCGAVSIGRLVDRIGSSWPLLLCTVATILGPLVPVLFSGYWSLAVLGLLVGGGAFGSQVVVNTLAGRAENSAERAANFSVMSMGISGANAVAPLVAGILIDHTGNHLLLLGLVAVLPVVSLGLMPYRHFPRIPRIPRGSAGETQAQKKKAMDLVRHPAVSSILIMSTLFVLLWDVFAVLAPLHGTQLALSATEIGLVVSTFSVASFAVRVVIGPLSRRFSAWRMLLTALFMAAIGVLAFGFSAALAALVVCAFVIGAGQGVGSPVSSAVLYEATPPDRVSEAMGLKVSLGMGTHIFVPFAVGALGAVIGIAPFLWFMGLLLLLGVWLMRGKWRQAV